MHFAIRNMNILWLMGGDLNGFQCTELFYKKKNRVEWGHVRATSPSVLLNASYY